MERGGARHHAERHSLQTRSLWFRPPPIRRQGLFFLIVRFERDFGSNKEDRAFVMITVMTQNESRQISLMSELHPRKIWDLNICKSVEGGNDISYDIRSVLDAGICCITVIRLLRRLDNGEIMIIIKVTQYSVKYVDIHHSDTGECLDANNSLSFKWEVISHGFVIANADFSSKLFCCYLSIRMSQEAIKALIQ